MSDRDKPVFSANYVAKRLWVSSAHTVVQIMGDPLARLEVMLVDSQEPDLREDADKIHEIWEYMRGLNRKLKDKQISMRTSALEEVGEGDE